MAEKEQEKDRARYYEARESCSECSGEEKSRNLTGVMESLPDPEMSRRAYMAEILKKAPGRPDYKRKDDFIRYYKSLEYAQTKYENHKDSAVIFIIRQFPYISWYVWGITLLVLLICVVSLTRPIPIALNLGSVENGTVIAAMMPFVSLFAVLESFRSKRYGIFELETAALYSFRGIYFARVACIGMVHLLLIIFLIIILGRVPGWGGYMMTAAMLTVPYLLTAVVNTVICRSGPGRKDVYVCTGSAIVISVLTMLILSSPDISMILKPEIWISIMILLAVIYISEIRRTWNQEALSWS